LTFTYSKKTAARRRRKRLLLPSLLLLSPVLNCALTHPEIVVNLAYTVISAVVALINIRLDTLSIYR